MWCSPSDVSSTPYMSFGEGCRRQCVIMLPARLSNYVEYLRKMILWQCSVSSAIGARAKHFSHGALTVLSRAGASPGARVAQPWSPDKGVNIATAAPPPLPSQARRAPA